MKFNWKNACRSVTMAGLRQSRILIKWIILGLICGIGIGLVSTAFFLSISKVTEFRIEHGSIIWLLPLAGLFITFLYRFANDENDRGTNLVLEAIQNKDDVPLNMTPLIFISTVITHLFGGSAGREGAAIQIGGSLGDFIGKLLKFNKEDRRVAILCGMAAAFSALFGTPISATVFAMEVSTIGIMQYSALVPCAIAAITSHVISDFFGCKGLSCEIDLQGISVRAIILIGVLAILCALLSISFCMLTKKAGDIFSTYIHNKYLRIFVGGLIIAALTFAVRNQDYNGLGIEVIKEALLGQTHYYTFAIKMIFTIITLAVGFKGGEIVPTLYIGATFGCAFGMICNLSPTLCAATAMGAMFCGVTNSPITALLLCFEMFGIDGFAYYIIAIAISYLMSGYFGLYRTQKFYKT